MAILPGGTRASPLVMILAIALLILCLLALVWYFQRTSSMPANPPMHTRDGQPAHINPPAAEAYGVCTSAKIS